VVGAANKRFDRESRKKLRPPLEFALAPTIISSRWG
jgi:hypothetical protein